MHSPNSEEIMEAMKIDNPKEWLDIRAEVLDEAIVEFNEVAEDLDSDLILAFRLSKEEYENVVNHISEELNDKK